MLGTEDTVIKQTKKPCRWEVLVWEMGKNKIALISMLEGAKVGKINQGRRLWNVSGGWGGVWIFDEVAKEDLYY